MISIRGCLLGGAVGDALGYAVEFLQEETIFEKYGDGGIREYDTGIKDVAMISDDTQMTLFTAAGLLLAQDRLISISNQAGYLSCISEDCSEWLITQTEDRANLNEPMAIWLGSFQEMFNWRAALGNLSFRCCWAPRMSWHH